MEQDMQGAPQEQEAPEPAEAGQENVDQSSMLDAISAGLDESAQEQGAPQPVTVESATAEALAKAEAANALGKTQAQAKDKSKQDELYKMPEGLKPASQERFRKLVDTTKAAVDKAERVQAQARQGAETIEGFRRVLAETHTSPQDLSPLLEYNRKCKTGDFAGALQLLDGQRKLLAQAMGQSLPGVDLLADFPDLQRDVAEKRLDGERALEVARSRLAAAGINQAARARQDSAQRAAAAQQGVNRAVQEISAFAAEMEKTDIDYPRKEKLLMPLLQEVAAQFPPELWARQISLLYRNIPALAAQAGPAVPQRQPLRPNSGGGGVPKPGSMAAAIDQGLGYGSGV